LIKLAYEKTDVPISRSQEEIRRLVMNHKGTGINFMSQPPREGFEALVTIQGTAYHIRVMATCSKKLNPEQELRRVWRVLFFHLKAMFEAADSGVIAVEDVILPYIVTPDNRTIAEHIRPKLAEARDMTAERVLTSAGFEPRLLK
jgi:hypothetical protein